MEENEQRKRRNTPDERWFDEPEPPVALKKKTPQTEGETAKGWRPPGWLTLGLMMLLAVMGMTFAYLRDETSPWDEDITAPLSQTEGHALKAPLRMKAMLTAAKKINFSGLADTNPWEWDPATLAEALDVHSAVIDNLRDLIEEKDEEWLSSALIWKEEDMGSRSEWKKIMLLKQAEAAFLASKKQEEAAFLAALDMAVLAHLLERLDSWPSFMHRAMELHERSAQSVAMLLQNTQLSQEKLRRLQVDEFAPWAPSEAALSRAMNGFYAFEKKLIMGPLPGEPALQPGQIPARSGWLTFKPNATLRLFADSFRELKDEAALTPFARVDQIGSRSQQTRRQAGVGIGSPNMSGEQYFSSRIKDYLDLLDAHSLARARHAGVMTLFAVRRYVAAVGRLPQSLQDLMPEYLPAPVIDPFSNEPLHYDAQRGLIYSVGMNLKDDGGSVTSVPFSDPKEPTVNIGIAVARKTK